MKFRKYPGVSLIISKKNDNLLKIYLTYGIIELPLRLPAFLKDKILLKVALVVLAILSLVELIRLKKKRIRWPLLKGQDKPHILDLLTERDR